MKKILLFLLPLVLLMAGCGDSNCCVKYTGCSNEVQVAPPANDTPQVQPPVQPENNSKYILRGHVEIIVQNYSGHYPPPKFCVPSIGRHSRSSDLSNFEQYALSNAVVTATNGVQTYVALTDEKGNFEFRNVVYSGYLLTVDKMLAAPFKAEALKESFLPDNEFSVSNNNLVLNAVDSVTVNGSLLYDVVLRTTGLPVSVGAFLTPSSEHTMRMESNYGTEGYIPVDGTWLNEIFEPVFGVEQNSEALRGVTLASEDAVIAVGYTRSSQNHKYTNHSADGTADGTVNILYPLADSILLNFGGTKDDYLNAVAIAPDGDIWCVGSTSSNDGDISKNNGGSDGWVLQLGKDGTLKKSLTFGGTADDVLNSLVISGDKIWCVGSSASNDGDISKNNGGSDGWVLCLNKDGEMVSTTLYGGSAKDELNSIALAPDGSLWAAGTTSSNDGNISANHGDSDGWVLHLNADGSLNSSKTFGGTSTDKLNGIAVTVDGAIWCAGSTKSTDGDLKENKGEEDAWVLFLNADGSLNRSKNYGGSGNECFYSVKSVGAAGVFVGTTNSMDLPKGFLTRSPVYSDAAWIIKIHPLELDLNPVVDVVPEP